jgi:F-box-like
VSQRVTIESLPDHVLLDIFDFYQVIINEYKNEHPYDWETLVHVCQRWRYLVFESPIRLNLQLFCTEKAPVRKMLHIWPALPLAILLFYDYPWDKLDNPFDNLIAALEHRDRVRQIRIINTVNYLWDQIVTAMQGPFPTLKYLSFYSFRDMFTLPDTFLNGSAPGLQHLNLRAISFPSLPRLLLSTSDLTSLRLLNIPSSGYISPVTMATSLSALPKLETLIIDFKSSTPHPERRNRPVPPPTRFILPALTELQFRGVSEYVEVLAAQIDAPLLDRITFKFFIQPELVFDIPQTVQFFGHLKWFRPASLALKFNPPYDASILFLPNPMSHPIRPRSWEIICKYLDWQLSFVAHICSQILHFRSSVESLSIQCPGLGPHSDPLEWIQQDEMDSTLWSQLFRSFTSIHSLDIPASLETLVAAALEGLAGESAAEVLPSLRSLSIVGKASDQTVQQGIQSFVAARQHSSHPVAISRRDVD